MMPRRGRSRWLWAPKRGMALLARALSELSGFSGDDRHNPEPDREHHETPRLWRRCRQGGSERDGVVGIAAASGVQPDAVLARRQVPDGDRTTVAVPAVQGRGAAVRAVADRTFREQ